MINAFHLDDKLIGFPLLLLDAFWDVIKGHNLFDNGCCDDIYDDDDDDSVH